MESDDYLHPPCDCCQKQLSEPYIECARCENIRLCTSCFAKGAEFAHHKSDHEYSIRRNDYPIFDNSDWTAKDEYLLLEAISRYGYGNWSEVSKMLQKYTELQCKDHYDYFYVDNPQCVDFPKFTMWSVITEDPPFLYKIVRDEEVPRDPDSEICRNLAGYNAFRSDFEMNYDNNAEQSLHFEEFDDDDDTELTQSLQCAIVLAYNSRLKERHRRYEIMKQHGLILYRKFNCWWQNNEEVLGKSLCSALTSFMQLLTATQFDKLVEYLHKEKEKRLQLYRLYELRRNGITTIKGRRLYETLKQRRDEYLKTIKVFNVRDLDWKQLSEDNPNSMTLIQNDLNPKMVKKKNVPPLEIIGLTDYEKLNEKEREFCSTVRITPTSFIKFRDLLLVENEKNGFLRLCDARKLIKIDVNKTRKLYDMLINEGAIKKPL